MQDFATGDRQNNSEQRVSTGVTSIALIGCGFVADYYLATLEKYPNLEIRGAYDKDTERLRQFCDFYKLRAYKDTKELLADREIQIVLNLTDPRSHYEVSLRCLRAGKHVYSEKPLAMNLSDAEELVSIAAESNLRISAAPCSVLSRAAQTLSYAVKENLVGRPRLVYAELEDGMVHRMPYKLWTSKSGAPWPYRDEFEIGCTIEHAAYYLTWLIDMFGPVSSVTAFSDCLVPDKVSSEPELNPPDTADFSVGVLKFESGVVVRLSTGIVADHDHSIRVFGDEGILYLNDCWDNESAVYQRKMIRIRRRMMLTPWKKKVHLPHNVAVNRMRRGSTRMDFLLGVDAFANAVRNKAALKLSEFFVLHVTEVTLALQNAGAAAGTYKTRIRF